ncbi:unnamed protein product [Commensalibacter communis]|uniref:Uncharacterized protein n=1 Tax=Commensalibacter communis TaxID=2972786 RepID=A0A9W4TQ82_9PROT|nr:unnamed protein product [Commensalibacter communis]CAI3949993.1 unnamed protein product [Commensalibacter communis]CAI3953114.1 unnamed protein product [Commensalibacter communis]CAI3954258.1 unnamed protein product [Commensalibacter communis]
MFDPCYMQPINKEELRQKAELKSKVLSSIGHHKVECPACQSVATVIGKEIGASKIENGEYEVVVRRSVIPTEFDCIACGLKIRGYPQLVAAKIGDYYTRRTTYSPQDYYGLIDPSDFDPSEYYGEEFNNE